MILYLDTSSIVKLYLEEDGSEDVRAAVRRARRVTTSLVAYAESRAALARFRSLRSVSQATYQRYLSLFEEQWSSFATIDVSERIVRDAGSLAERYGLRGYDAVHLASALYVRRESRSDMLFSTWDGELLAAAGKEGLAPAH